MIMNNHSVNPNAKNNVFHNSEQVLKTVRFVCSDSVGWKNGPNIEYRLLREARSEKLRAG